MKPQRLFVELQNFYELSRKALLGVFRKPFYFRDTIEQMDYAGAGSFFIVVLVSLFIGMALSLQISTELSSLGLKMYTGKIVGISIIREIGPVAIALSYAGRVGSGMASEIGSMVLGHQVDMLRVFGIDPFKKLVTPRVLSSTIMLPLLTVIGDAVSLFGGYYISVFVSHQSGSFYWSQIRAIMNFQNIFSGIVKPFIFGFVIACISCYMGLATRGGARGLRQATTTAVVLSTIMIIITDFLLTRILFIVLGMQA
ncbi:MAG TPA: ABC transporter permease [Nitrospirota bacterium]|nr:ABC transporter permease [Nitrospirota bacterium]